MTNLSVDSGPRTVAVALAGRESTQHCQLSTVNCLLSFSTQMNRAGSGSIRSCRAAELPLRYAVAVPPSSVALHRFQGLRMPASRYHSVLLFGAPGVGKGTQ